MSERENRSNRLAPVRPEPDPPAPPEDEPVVEEPVADEEPSKAQKAASRVGADRAAGLATSKTKATGKQVHVPKTREEIARAGTALADDAVTGGDNASAQGRDVGEARAQPTYERLWAMDNDHVTDYRNNPDPLQPDASQRG